MSLDRRAIAMLYLQMCFIFGGVCLSLAQNTNFEYECDILHRLEYLENALKDSEAKDRDTAQQLASMENALKESEVKDRDTAQQLTSLENALKESEVKDRDTAQQLASLENKVKILEDRNGYVSSGSTYIRLGRTSCPGNGSQLVYQGVVGGGNYIQPGSAVNHLCLPLDPQYGEYFEDAQQGGDAVYGTEYQLLYRTDYMKFFPDIDYSRGLYDNDVPCAVCQVSRSTAIMVPAKNTCMDGWTLEYKGHLVAGRQEHAAASEYICLDDQPETVVGGAANLNGNLLYFVEGRCGSLPCPPYVDGRELTCAVCTK